MLWAIALVAVVLASLKERQRRVAAANSFAGGDILNVADAAERDPPVHVAAELLVGKAGRPSGAPTR